MRVRECIVDDTKRIILDKLDVQELRSSFLQWGDTQTHLPNCQVPYKNSVSQKVSNREVHGVFVVVAIPDT